MDHRTVRKLSNANSSTALTRTLFLLSRLFLGGIFVYASYDKLLHPVPFAEIVYNYQILPDPLVNLVPFYSVDRAAGRSVLDPGRLAAWCPFDQQSSFTGLFQHPGLQSSSRARHRLRMLYHLRRPFLGRAHGLVLASRRFFFFLSVLFCSFPFSF